MALSSNSSSLINTLENLPTLDGRYVQIKCVNINASTGESRGVLSLVFKAFDQIDQCHVALKFYDIDPNKLFDRYRVDSFQREHLILRSLLNVPRCLQVASSYSTYLLQVPQSDGKFFEIPCPYFAVEWIEHEIDHFFEQQDSIDPVEKLRLFNDIVLAVEALHRHDVHHRDLKKDNLRARHESPTRTVIAIDLGTAARSESPPLRPDYDDGHVGARAYAAPEAICCLSGLRQIARFTDVYALGCILFELFNRDLFIRELLNRNSAYQAILTVMGLSSRAATTPTEKLAYWHHALGKHGKGVAPVSIRAAGNSVPLGIVDLLDDLVQLMTSMDYRNRPKSLELVRRKIQSAILCLQNERAYQKRLEATKARRTAQLESIASKRQRFDLALTRRLQNAD